MHLWGVVGGRTSSQPDRRGLVADGIDCRVSELLIGRVADRDGGRVVSDSVISGVVSGGIGVRLVNRDAGLPDQVPGGQGGPLAGHGRLDLPGH